MTVLFDEHACTGCGCSYYKYVQAGQGLVQRVCQKENCPRPENGILRHDPDKYLFLRSQI